MKLKLLIFLLLVCSISLQSQIIGADSIRYIVTNSSNNSVALYDCSKKDTLLNIPSTVTVSGQVYNVTSIYSNALCRNYNLTTVTIPSSVTSIGDCAFQGLRDLNRVSLSSSLSSIGYCAFSTCISLKSIIIPATVQSIGYSAFEWCQSLNSIYVSTNTPLVLNVSAGIFYGVTTKSCILHVPSGSKEIYQSADVWKDFIILEDNINSISSLYAPGTINYKVQNNLLQLDDLPLNMHLLITNIDGKIIRNQYVENESMSIILPIKGIYTISVGHLRTKITTY